MAAANCVSYISHFAAAFFYYNNSERRSDMYLLPVPKEVVYRESEYALPHKAQIVLAQSCTQQVYEYALLLKESLQECGCSCSVRRGGSGGTVSLAADESMPEQKYYLEIGEKGIRIVGGGDSGILYAVQTLRQILQQSGLLLPHMEVTDWPDYEVRGFYHDAARGRVPRMEWLEALVDTLSFYKINQLQLYIEHSYLFAGMSELWRDDTPLTSDDILALDRYCQKRGVELVPSLSTFGHLYKLLSTTQYRRYCELPDAGGQPFGFKQRMDHHTINVSDKDAFSLICDMIAQFLPLFSSKRFNICADETFDLGRGKNKERAEREGKDRLYMDYVKKLCAFVTEQGSTPMLWGDVLLGFPQLASELPEEAICLNWGYAPDQSEESTRIYAGTGVRQYVCPGVGGWNQFINLQRSAYENISRMSSYGVKYGCEGLLNTDWGDFGHINHPAFSIPGMICGAAASWNAGELPEYERLNRQISVLQYGDASERFSGLTGILSEQVSFGWHDAVLLKELWAPQGKEELCARLEESRAQIKTGPQKCKKIEECIHELKRCTRTMEGAKRRMVYPYLLAAQGIQIFNQIGELLLDAVCGDASCAQTDFDRADAGENRTELSRRAYDTASALEEWYYHYRTLWNTVSRESELYRVSEVIFWYADTLRERVAKYTW